MPTIHLLGNPKGGSNRSRIDPAELATTYAQLGYEAVDLTGEKPEESEQALWAALERGEVERVVVAATDVIVGIVASGTGNDFAAALGLEGGGVEATLADPIAVDLIRVESDDGDRYVASIAIVGFPARINARANTFRFRLGSAIYTIAAALEIPRFRRDQVELEVDGEIVTTDTAMLAFGNTRYFGGGMLACPEARPDDQLLHLTSIEGVGRLGILRHLAGRKGGTAERPEVMRRTARAIEITTPHLDLWGDGEPIASTPARLSIHPRALRVAGAVVA